METDAFKLAAKELESIASTERTACMCAEALWWRCHRSLVSDYLRINGLKVIHIMGIDKFEEHPYTSPAVIVNGQLRYPGK
jgi:uncharacterized protein (DUF488 family)